MKKEHWTILITLCVIIILAVTNPSTDEHKQAVKTKVNSFVQKSYQSETPYKTELETAGYNLGVMIGSSIVDKFIENAVSRESYVIFSLTKINWQGKSKTIGYGFLGNVFLSEGIDSSLQDSFSGNDQVLTEEAPITEEPYFEESPVSETPPVMEAPGIEDTIIVPEPIVEEQPVTE